MTSRCKKLWAKFLVAFQNEINWCEGEYADGTPKPPNKVLDWCYRNWLRPFEQNDCCCCNNVRSLLYGSIIGATLGWKWLLAAIALICCISGFKIIRSML